MRTPGGNMRFFSSARGAVAGGMAACLLTGLGCGGVPRAGEGGGEVGGVRQRTDFHHQTVLLEGAQLPASGVVPPAPNGAELVGEAALLEGNVLTLEPFTELLLSWNVRTPPGTGVRFEARVARGEEGAAEWSPWLAFGAAGDVRVPGTIVRSAAFADGTTVRMDIDVLVVSGPVRRVQWRMVAVRGRFVAGLSGEAEHGLLTPVVLSRVAVCATGELGRVEISRTSSIAPEAVRELGVPFRSQKTEDPRIAGRVCSPTSVAMALAFAASKNADAQEPAPMGRPVMDVCTRAYDATFDLFGNWPRNVQAAYELGTPGYLTRMDDWAVAHALIARGVPIIASIRVKTGELRNAPYPATDGHLIVLIGFTEEGDAIALDPAVESAAKGRRIYRHEDLERVWFEGSAGTTYVIGL